MIYIILPVHNRRDTTEKFLNSLIAQHYTNFELILIDDGSEDGTDLLAKKKIKNISIIYGRGNWWWAGSLQQGIDFIINKNLDCSDVVLFINDDVTFEPDFLQMAINLLIDENTMLLPNVFNPLTGCIEETGIHADFKDLSFETASGKAINCLPTRGIFMKYSALKKVGSFYPKLLPHYLSDYEYTIRAKRLGINLVTSSDLIIQYDSSTTGYHDFKNLNFFRLIKKLFSKKSSSNPIYWSSFIFLSSPIRYIPINLYRVWASTFRTIFINIQLPKIRK